MRFWKLKCPEDGCPFSFWFSKNYCAHLESHIEFKKGLHKILYFQGVGEPRRIKGGWREEP
jgi:hypothetical protein